MFQNKVYESFQENEEMVTKYFKPGIYKISICGRCIYIGKSVNMLYRLSQHINLTLYPNLKVKKSLSNKYIFLREARRAGYSIDFDVMYEAKATDEQEIEEEIGEMEGKLIRQYMPILNYQIPRAENWRSFTVQKEASKIRFEDWCKAQNLPLPG